MVVIKEVDLSPVTGVTAGSEPNIQQFQDIGNQIAESFEKTGFVYVKNHGIEQDLIESLFKTSMDFFNLDEKEKATFTKGPELQGWVQMGVEKLTKKLETRESFDATDISPNGIFPDNQMPALREDVTKFCNGAITVSKILLKSLSLALGKPEDFLISKSSGVNMRQNKKDGDLDSLTTFRTLYYPPISDNLLQKDSELIRCGEHTDFGLITLLCQDVAGGPEVQTIDEEWIYADYKPGCLLVNCADLLEIISDGRFPATNHRVPLPQDPKLRGSKRQVVAFFVHSDDDVAIEPISGDYSHYKPTTSVTHGLNKLERLCGHTYGREMKTKQ